MKIQFAILLFVACLNLSTGLIIALALPGTEYVQAANPSNSSDYESHFNATQTSESWGATPFSGIPVIGDIFSGLNFLFRNFQYLIDGFPMLLTWLSDTFITDGSARVAFAVIANVMRALFAVLMTVFAIEFISGRHATD